MKKKLGSTHKSKPSQFIQAQNYFKLLFSSRIIDIQVQMCERAVELLLLPDDTPCYLLDVGCGSGLSGSVLEDQGHYWVGMDISTAMLGKCRYLILELLLKV